MNIYAWLSGILGITANVIIYQQKNGKQVLIYKLISDFIWAYHYYTLDAYSGMAVAMVGVLREIVFLTQQKNKVSKIWLIIFIGIAVICAFFTWKGVISILPAAASILSVISFWKANPEFTRIIAYPISICMLTYDIVYKSYTGITNEILTLISSTIGILRNKKISINYDQKNSRNNLESNDYI